MPNSGITKLVLKATHQQHPTVKKVQTVLPYQGYVGIIMLYSKKPLTQRAHNSFTWTVTLVNTEGNPPSPGAFPRSGSGKKVGSDSKRVKIRL